jgi:hypothetical protein
VPFRSEALLGEINPMSLMVGMSTLIMIYIAKRHDSNKELVARVLSLRLRMANDELRLLEGF